MSSQHTPGIILRWTGGVFMTEPVNEIEALRAERDELRERVDRITGALGGAVSRILWYYAVSSVPEDLARTIDDRIAPVRWATGWPPYLDPGLAFMSQTELLKRGVSEGSCLAHTQTRSCCFERIWRSSTSKPCG